MKKLISCCLLLCFLLCSCTVLTLEKKYTAYSFDYFDTITSVIGYAEDENEFSRIKDEIFALLGEYHRLYSIYDESDDNLYAVNRAREPLEVDRRIIDLLLFSKDMHALTGGKVNVAMGSVLSIWHEYRTAGIEHPENAELPPHELLKEAADHIDINNIVIDEARGTVYLADPGMSLDVGAVAKGFAAEAIARELESRGITGYVINVGGNVRTIGAQANGGKWSVGVEDPDSGEMYLAVLSLAGESLVTSGSYQRFYTVGGHNYNHIIDPAALYPAEKYVSVSVVSSDSALADALSTALFLMDFDDGVSLIESCADAEAMWLKSNGEIQYSSGFEKHKNTGA